MGVSCQHATYALKNNQIVSVEDVERGSACGCICAACGAPLLAKKGEVREHHFAHKRGHKCDFEYETSLHLAAKKILSEAPTMTIPSVYVRFPKSYKQKELISAERSIHIDDVKLEPRYDGFVPDVQVCSEGNELLIEIFVTHPVCEEKLDIIKKKNISVIEIDLSQYPRTITEEELKKVLIECNHIKTWLYSRKESAWYQKFLKECETLRISSRGFVSCPKKQILLKNKYAHMNQCEQCEYCIEYTSTQIKCSGRNLIASKKDFDLSIDERKASFFKKNNQKLTALKKSHKQKESHHEYNEVKHRFTQQESPIFDSCNRRWIQCKICNKIKLSTEFLSYGGKGEVNLGVCSECSKKQIHNHIQKIK